MIISKKLNDNVEMATITRVYLRIRKMLPNGIEDFNVWIGGGCFVRTLTNENISDIDFFGSSREELGKFAWFLYKQGFKLYFANQNAIKGYIQNGNKRVNIDVIKIIFDNEEKTVKAFDFSICKIAINPSTNNLYFYESAFIDLLQRRLVIPGELTHPLGTMKRLQRYVRRGYQACDGTILTIAKSISLMDFENPQQNMIEFYSDGTTTIPAWD